MRPWKFPFSVLAKKRLRFDLIHLQESTKEKVTDSQFFYLGKGKHNEFQTFTVADKFKLQIASLFNTGSYKPLGRFILEHDGFGFA